MDPFIGQIIMFGGNFAPRGWAFCDGQLLSIAENSALFSILGTTYGGDGRTTFGLPDLRGRVSVHAGNGPGLPQIRLGAKAGASTVTLQVANLASHSHNATSTLAVPAVSGDDANQDDPHGNKPGVTSENTYSNAAADGSLAALTGGVTNANTGGNTPFSVYQPYTAVNYIIALQGTFPSRN